MLHLKGIKSFFIFIGLALIIGILFSLIRSLIDDFVAFIFVLITTISLIKYGFEEKE